MFEGFSPETVDFLWGIRMNNNREWFLERSGSVLKVSRIYREARMHHPVPYKESLWICIRQDVEWWAENPCLFFEIGRAHV